MKFQILRVIFITLVLITGILLVIGTAQANILQNGSFEIGTNPGCWSTFGVGSTAITNWTVIRGPIENVTCWQASDGNRSLDLDVYGQAGGIAQTFATTPGVSYNVFFDMAGNPNAGPTIKEMRVQADGQLADFTFDITGYSMPDMGWETMSWQFTADDSQATLEFYSLHATPSDAGPALDNVSVSVVPEPISSILFITGGATLGFRRFRKK